MLATGLQLLLAPLLAGLSGAVALRWDDRRGGLVSAFPAIVGPLLLVAAHEHGRPFAARLAVGTLLGLVALSGFAVVYARAAQRWSWPLALAMAWGAAVSIATAAGAVAGASWIAAAAAATVSLIVAARALPPAGASPAHAAGTSVLARIWLTAVLVVALAVAAGRFGAVVAGILAALPVLASVLAVTTHRQQDASAVCALMAGMLTGMASFVGFCVVIAALLVPFGAPLAFALASVVAVLAQVGALAWTAHRAGRGMLIAWPAHG